VYVPSLVFFEVYKKICQSGSEDIALKAVAFMSRFHSLDLTRDIALTAADHSISYKMAMADSFVWAHAMTCQAKLITLDNDFAGLPMVKVIR
jgi:predicted nucleic acid-binding protein